MASDIRADLQDTSSAWPALVARTGSESWLLVAFAICYAPLVWLGYAYKTGPDQLSVLWPAVGFLLAVLILAPVRRWPVLIVLQLTIEYLVAWLVRDPSVPGGILLFMIPNSIDAMVGALVARSQLWRVGILRVGLALQFPLASAVGATVSATIGAASTLLNYGAFDYVTQWQLWWTGNWLGTLVMAPPLLFWALPVRRQYASLRVTRPVETIVLGLLLAASTWVLFDRPSGAPDSLLQTPAVPVAILLAIAFRLQLRWASLLALGGVMLAAARGAADPGNFVAEDPVTRMLVLQTHLIMMAAVPLIVGTLVTSMRMAMDQVSTSEARYRTFIELSSEAIWRVEIAPPMPVSLPVDAQRDWIRRHARVAESNGAFDRYLEHCTEGLHDHGSSWQPGRSWCALYEAQLENLAASNHSMDGLRFVAQVDGRERTFIVTFNGIVADGYLQRFWCVAREVSEIVDLNTRLLRERERLRAYAHQIANAEERARRATAVDLHDGIGQALTGMAMTLEVARMQAPQVAPLLDDVRTSLRSVQERTRNMIADLSPPGLYELGLGPALQWLVVHFRSQDKLRVQLRCDVREEAIPMDLRVLVFKLVRELLRNVVKHSGVDTARVNVKGDARKVVVEVTDAGRGFEWQMEMFGPRPGQFGLWSISDRVSDFGGEFRVDTAPGEGAKFTLEFPLSTQRHAGN